MRSNAQTTPLTVIQQDLLDGTISTTRMLQKCIVLAGSIGSTELRDWARRELDGYPQGVELPAYRKIHAQLLVDGQKGPHLFKSQGIGPEDLPDVVREAGIGNEVPVRNALAEIEAFAEHVEPFVRLSLPNGEMIVKMMNYELGKKESFATFHRVYYSASRASFKGVVEGVRTALAELISELVRTLPPDQQLPSKEQADQAVSVTVTGKGSQITVNNSQASAGSTSSATMIPTEAPKEESWWTRTRKRGVVITLVAMAGAVAGVLKWLEINPFN